MRLRGVRADAKLLVQGQYNRVVQAVPSLRRAPRLLAHLFGRLVYLFTTVVWPFLARALS